MDGCRVHVYVLRYRQFVIIAGIKYRLHDIVLVSGVCQLARIKLPIAFGMACSISRCKIYHVYWRFSAKTCIFVIDLTVTSTCKWRSMVYLILVVTVHVCLYLPCYKFTGTEVPAMQCHGILWNSQS